MEWNIERNRTEIGWTATYGVSNIIKNDWREVWSETERDIS